MQPAPVIRLMNKRALPIIPVCRRWIYRRVRGHNAHGESCCIHRQVTCVEDFAVCPVRSKNVLLIVHTIGVNPIRYMSIYTSVPSDVNNYGNRYFRLSVRKCSPRLLTIARRRAVCWGTTPALVKSVVAEVCLSLTFYSSKSNGYRTHITQLNRCVSSN